MNLIFVLTTECQLSCPHCLRGEVGPQHLSFEVFRKAIEGARPYGIENVHLTGGEPFLYRQLGEVFAYAERERLSLTFSTNGLLLFEHEELLKKYRNVIRMLHVSVESPKPQVYEAVRGKGHFKAVCEALKFCRRLRIPFSVLCCVSRINKDEAGPLIRFARKQKAAFAVFTTVLPCGRARKNGVELSEPERRLLLDELLKRQSVHAFDPLNIFSLPVHIGEPVFASDRQAIMCSNQGLRNLTVDVDGKLHFCCFLTVYGLSPEAESRIKIVSLLDHDFDEAYGEFVRQMGFFCQGRLADLKAAADKDSLDFNSCFYCHKKLGL